MSRIHSGCVRQIFSLQFSRPAPPKSSSVGLRACSMVPIAPSRIRMREDTASSKSFRREASMPQFTVGGDGIMASNLKNAEEPSLRAGIFLDLVLIFLLTGVLIAPWFAVGYANNWGSIES